MCYSCWRLWQQKDHKTPAVLSTCIWVSAISRYIVQGTGARIPFALRWLLFFVGINMYVRYFSGLAHKRQVLYPSTPATCTIEHVNPVLFPCINSNKFLVLAIKPKLRPFEVTPYVCIGSHAFAMFSTHALREGRGVTHTNVMTFMNYWQN